MYVTVIEGSTRLLHDLGGSRYSYILAEQQRIRVCVRRNTPRTYDSYGE
jgi:hypothetical protein